MLSRDLFVIGCLYYVASFIDVVATHTWSRLLLWSAWGLLQGCMWFGPWILGHEAGHGAFSPVKAVNDGVGLVLHTFLLTPYFSWKFSHATHHGSTGSVEKDTAFAPDLEDDVVGMKMLYVFDKLELLKEIPILNLVYLGWMLLIGFWLYLGINAGGAGRKLGWKHSHFNVESTLFSSDAQQKTS